MYAWHVSLEKLQRKAMVTTASYICPPYLTFVWEVGFFYLKLGLENNTLSDLHWTARLMIPDILKDNTTFNGQAVFPLGILDSY